MKNKKQPRIFIEPPRLKWDFIRDKAEEFCVGSARFGQMSIFLKLQIICNNLKLGEMHDNQEKVQNFI